MKSTKPRSKLSDGPPGYLRLPVHRTTVDRMRRKWALSASCLTRGIARSCRAASPRCVCRRAGLGRRPSRPRCCEHVLRGAMMRRRSASSNSSVGTWDRRVGVSRAQRVPLGRGVGVAPAQCGHQLVGLSSGQDGPVSAGGWTSVCHPPPWPRPTNRGPPRKATDGNSCRSLAVRTPLRQRYGKKFQIVDIVAVYFLSLQAPPTTPRGRTL